MKALIVYGTRWGSTEDIARRICETLMSKGNSVEIADVKKGTPNIDPYDLVVIGSGISMGKWTKETLHFLRENAGSLRNKKTAFFVSCGLILRKGGLEKTQQDYLAKVANEYNLHPIGFGPFGGYIDFSSDYGIFGSLFVRSSKKKCQKIGVDTTKPYDFRNWVEINNWAERLTVEAEEA